MSKFYHPFHLVSESPWPLLGSFSVFYLLLGMINFLNLININLINLGNFMLIMILIQWWRDVVRESTFQGCHLNKVVDGLRLGMVLFILSEVMFFSSFFWTYFHLFLSPSVEIGSYWPPFNIVSFNPYNIPLLNTLILLSSGFSITWCHYMILNKQYIESLKGIIITVLLGGLFTFFQYLEYSESYFSIADSSYGSIFFMVTGFHGLHVLIGTIFIMVSTFRLFGGHYSEFHHFGFEAASWYWHFVDVVWLFLYIFIYWLSY